MQIPTGEVKNQVPFSSLLLLHVNAVSIPHLQAPFSMAEISTHFRAQKETVLEDSIPR